MKLLLRVAFGSAIIGSLAVLMLGCSTAPHKPAQLVRGDYGYTARYLSWLIPREMDRLQVHGLSIALVDDQRVVWSKGFGFADGARQIPATERTLYGIGSVTKLFTATAVMQLVNDGNVELDAPLTNYVPEFSIRSRFRDTAPITVRDLLTHHAGLPGDHLQGMWTRQPAPFGQVVPLLKSAYASSRPGTVYSYSNLGYSLLGLVIEKASGRDYFSYMHDALLAPLGMHESTFAVDTARQSRLAVGYRKGEPGAEHYFLRDAPAGALFSSTADMTCFIRMLFAEGRAGTQPVLSAHALHGMWSAQNTGVPLDMDLHVGLGWMLGQSGIDYAGPVVRHNGGTLGTASELMLLPRHKLGVIVLANAPEASAMLNGIAVKALKLALEAKTGVLEPAVKEFRSPARAPMAAERLATLAGNYASSLNVMVPVVTRGDHLQAEFQGQTFALWPQDNGALALQLQLFGWIPVNIAGLDKAALRPDQVAGRDVVALEYEGKRTLAAVRVAPYSVSPAWRRRVGRYVIANPGEDGVLAENLELAYEHGALVLHYALPEAPGYRAGIMLRPINDDEAISEGLGRFTGETYRVINIQGEERLLYSGYQLRRAGS
jgi:CubicO group peptidase (beta-lactamase class C family)